MVERPILTMGLVCIVALLIITYEQRKSFRINKIFNFRKELKRIKKKRNKIMNASNSTLIRKDYTQKRSSYT